MTFSEDPAKVKQKSVDILSDLEDIEECEEEADRTGSMTTLDTDVYKGHESSQSFSHWLPQMSCSQGWAGLFCLPVTFSFVVFCLVINFLSVAYSQVR